MDNNDVQRLQKKKYADPEVKKSLQQMPNITF